MTSNQIAYMGNLIKERDVATKEAELPSKILENQAAASLKNQQTRNAKIEGMREIVGGITDVIQNLNPKAIAWNLISGGPAESKAFADVLKGIGSIIPF